MKKCSLCKILKSYTEFHKRTAMKDGYRSACKDCARSTYVKHKYRLSFDEYDELKERQGNRCAICRIPAGDHSLCVDHCHDTAKVRGLLCKNCNRGLGLLGDNLENIQAALQYLKHLRSN